jgi:DinB superfamily
MSEDLRYPVGPCEWPGEVTVEERWRHLRDIAELPAKLREAVAGLAPQHLDIPYREGGWTIRQIVHHIPDSHMNSYVRFKLALTEDQPTIKPYDEKLWAEIPEARTAPIEVSLDMVDALHGRWSLMLANMTDADFERSIFHPEIGALTLKSMVAGYGWHCRHHVAQIVATRRRMGW